MRPWTVFASSLLMASVAATSAPVVQARTLSDSGALFVGIQAMDAKRAIGLAVIAAPGVRLVEGQPLPGSEALALSVRSRLVVDSAIDEARRIWSIEIKSGTTVVTAKSICRKLISSGTYTRCGLITISAS
jgi:hypothetical protein